MAEREPILCRVQIGALRPENEAASEVLQALGNGTLVRIEVVKAAGNVKRMRLYWKMLRVALDNLSDAFDGPMKPNTFHLWLKRRLGRSTAIHSKSTGEIIGWDDESIAFHNMTEAERSDFVTEAADLLAKRLGVPVEILMDEARAGSA